MRLLARIVAHIQFVGELEVGEAGVSQVIPDDKIGLLPVIRASLLCS